MPVSTEQIDALLPQTQCTRCGYPDCRSYARAIADGAAAINQCPPGGDAGIRELAALTGQAYLPLNPDHGTERSIPPLAVIDEARCIGCTLCIQACPVDAIVGANLQMHTVIAAACTGCELCIPPCPVDCIVLETPAATPATRTTLHAQAADLRARFRTRNARLEGEREEQRSARAQRKAMLRARQTSSDPSEAPRQYDPVAAALARVRKP